jgi:Asp-tRNA(Asn)/Glu-tRNA(Gln) amidotransferase A subunit family amidase
MAGQEQIVPVIGPISASFEGCQIFMKTLIDQKPWRTEPSLLPLAWNYPPTKSHLLKEDGKKKLRIGVLWSDGVVQPHPPVTRALKELTQRLSGSEGFEVVEWKPYRHDLAWDIISALYFCDGAKQDREAVAASGEPWRPLSEFILNQPGVPDREYTVSEVWGLTIRREEYRKAYALQFLENPVDVILCPAGPGAAPPLDHAKYWGYTSQWNLLDYPAMIFPVTQVDPTRDLPDPNYKPLNDQDEFNFGLYNPRLYADAPVSLQLVGRRYEDEKVFEAMELIRTAVGGSLPLAPFK